MQNILADLKLLTIPLHGDFVLSGKISEILHPVKITCFTVLHVYVSFQVNKDALKNDEEPSPPKRCRYEEGGQQQICHLSSKLIGQHGGALLAHFPCKSSIQYGLFGFIVQCTSVSVVESCNVHFYI